MLNPKDTMKPYAQAPTNETPQQALEHLLHPHGQMSKTLHETEKRHKELTNLSESDTGGNEDQ